MQLLVLLINFLVFKSIFAVVVVERDKQEVTIECIGGTKWFNPFGKLIVDSDKYKIDGSNLTIYTIGEIDAGEYYCFLEKRNFSIYLYSKDQDVVIEGDKKKVTIQCFDVKKWFSPSGKLIVDSDKYKVEGNNLTINMIGDTDDGEYMCLVENSNFSIVLSFKDVILERNQKKGTITCIDGTKWFSPSGKLIVDSDKYKIEGDSLTINMIGETDVGEYYCLVGNSNFSIYLYSPPYIVELPKSINVVQGHPVVLLCKVWGFNIPYVRWFMIVDGAEDYQMSNNNTLFIPTASADDYDNYRCLASNFQGDVNQTTKIIVKNKVPVLWPFIVAVLAVLLLVVVITIINSMFKKRNQTAQENPKDATPAEAT